MHCSVCGAREHKKIKCPKRDQQKEQQEQAERQTPIPQENQEQGQASNLQENQTIEQNEAPTQQSQTSEQSKAKAKGKSKIRKRPLLPWRTYDDQTDGTEDNKNNGGNGDNGGNNGDEILQHNKRPRSGPSNIPKTKLVPCSEREAELDKYVLSKSSFQKLMEKLGGPVGYEEIFMPTRGLVTSYPVGGTLPAQPPHQARPSSSAPLPNSPGAICG